MHAVVNARVRHLLHKTADLRPTANLAWRRAAGGAQLWHRPRADLRPEDGADRRSSNTVRARVLGVHWGINEWHPRGITLGHAVAVRITVSNRSDGPPEIVVILRVEHRDQRVVHRLCGNGEQASVLRALSPRRVGDRPHHRKVDRGCRGFPETGDVRLFRGPACAVLCAERLDLVIVARPQFAVEAGGRFGAELISAGHDPRFATATAASTDAPGAASSFARSGG